MGGRWAAYLVICDYEYASGGATLGVMVVSQGLWKGGGGGEWQRRCRGQMLLAFRSHKAGSLHAFYMAEAISSQRVQSRQK